MRRVVRTEAGLVVGLLAGLLVAYIGIAVTVTGRHRAVGVLVVAVGVWSLAAAPVVHDRLHEENGEARHALWGRGERRKPRWWPSR